MSERNDNWGPEDDDVVRRLRESKPQMSSFELDRVKTTVLSRVKPSTRGSGVPRNRFVVAALTLGLMVAGTAGAVAGSHGGVTPPGSGAAESQYHPCHFHPELCNPNHDNDGDNDGSTGPSDHPSGGGGGSDPGDNPSGGSDPGDNPGGGGGGDAPTTVAPTTTGTTTTTTGTTTIPTTTTITHTPTGITVKKTAKKHKTKKHTTKKHTTKH